MVFLAEEGEPGLWCGAGEHGCVLVCPTGNDFVMEGKQSFVKGFGTKLGDGVEILNLRFLGPGLIGIGNENCSGRFGYMR